ncbi:MAG: hypothetical protein P8Y30_07930 [candidate division WOR-3 bacterium]
MKKIAIILFLLSFIGCKGPQSDEIERIQNKITEITNKLKTVEEGSRLKAKDGIDEFKDKIEKLDSVRASAEPTMTGIMEPARKGALRAFT